MLTLLDRAFFAFHTLLIGFNMVGWAWRPTRVAHRVVVGLTAFSWFAMGAYYGWGYCLCTDWHFRVRRRLGYPVRESSFIQLLADKALGVPLSRPVADNLALWVFVAIVLATAITWALEWRQRRAGRAISMLDQPRD